MRFKYLIITIDFSGIEMLLRVKNGIYDKPRFSHLLNEPVVADSTIVVYTITRKKGGL